MSAERSGHRTEQTLQYSGVQTSGWRRKRSISAAEHVAHAITWKICRAYHYRLHQVKDLTASARWPRKSVVCQCLQHQFAGNHFYLRTVHIQGAMYLVWLYILPKFSCMNSREITLSRHQQRNWTLDLRSKPCIWQAIRRGAASCVEAQVQQCEHSNMYPTRCSVTQFILSGNCSTCFGWYHPSSGAQTTISSIWYLSHRYCYLPL